MALKIKYEYWDPPHNTRLKRIEYRNALGQLHRPWREGPAEIWYRNTPDNIISSEQYYENDNWHRPYKEGPARIFYYAPRGNRIFCENYYETNKRHRPHKIGCAKIEYYNTPDIRVRHTVYYENGMKIFL